jgi:hypothetical protein
MDHSSSVLWAPLFCKVCSRRAAVVVGNALMCGDCFFKHSVTELGAAESQDAEVIASTRHRAAQSPPATDAARAT